jgi:hypothetical protein
MGRLTRTVGDPKTFIDGGVARSRLHPLRFKPILKRLIWGGRRLGSVLNKPLGEGDDYAESCEIADHLRGPDRTSSASGNKKTRGVLGCLLRLEQRRSPRWGREVVGECQSGRPDSNWRPPAPKAGALARLRYAPSRIGPSHHKGDHRAGQGSDRPAPLRLGGGMSRPTVPMNLSKSSGLVNTASNRPSGTAQSGWSRF